MVKSVQSPFLNCLWQSSHHEIGTAGDGQRPQSLGTVSLLTSVRSKNRLRKMKAMFSQPTSCHRKGADGCEVGVRENAPEEAG